ncbi:MAG: uroporphyrinogen-III C-methyltransferase [Gammaproteobacteria bacterium]|nr:uroporphyrinogen-III C-methyltransferase [Gammaproteobacteria bacterium]MCB1926003.1 uroporphyrinogen-III C-methyltransferase [Gammaproteobacteria bacterium]
MQVTGKVFLVGAGPGDPGLLTVKALELLRSADVVVYDRLVSPHILDLIPDEVMRISVGKASGRHSVPQDQINQLLVDLCLADTPKPKRVVRLKGGDPFIFGRGSEEALHLHDHGIPFEVVPGVTAAAACSAYAGVPLTHRGMSHGVRLVTGHFLENKRLKLDWRALADPDSTIVIYMGLASLERICNSLINEGMDPATPAVAIQDGTTDRQRRVFGDLATLSKRVKSSRLTAPVLVVIGRTVALAGQLDWFSIDKEHVSDALAGASNF